VLGDELNLKAIDWKRLHQCAVKYPRSIRRALETIQNPRECRRARCDRYRYVELHEML